MTPEQRLERITNKMAERFGGNAEQYKEFALKRLDKQGWEIVKEYCDENKI